MSTIKRPGSLTAPDKPTRVLNMSISNSWQ